ncbi:MAG: guanylate kinase [Pseudomonadota bacterium]|nr:MAG: guanylate kinase [Pseudomonadota bacterium]
MSNSGEIYIIAAPSGAGKTSLINALIERCPRLALSISDTTRPARRGEVDGEHYHFVDVDTFRQGVGAGRYLEHAEVFGNLYGTSHDRVRRLWDQGRDVLLEIDVQGAAQVRQRHPGTCAIFILPPSLETLARRLEQRGLDAPDVIRRRLGEAQREIGACRDFDWMVVNQDFERAVTDLQAIITAWPLRRSRQASRVARLLDESASRITIRD